MSIWSLTYQQSVFKRHHSDKHFSGFSLTKWRQKSTGIDTERHYVTVTLRIIAVVKLQAVGRWLRMRLQKEHRVALSQTAVERRYRSRGHCRSIVGCDRRPSGSRSSRFWTAPSCSARTCGTWLLQLHTPQPTFTRSFLLPLVHYYYSSSSLSSRSHRGPSNCWHVL